MAHVVYRFVFDDGSVELVPHGSIRYNELTADGHTPAGTVEGDNGVSDNLEAYLAARFGEAVTTSDMQVAQALAWGTESPAVVEGIASGAASVEVASQKGVPDGIAPLDTAGRLPEAHVPERLSADNITATVTATSDTLARRMALTGADDETTLQAWLDALPAGAVGVLWGSATLAGSVTVPAGVTLDMTAATLTQTVAAGSTLVLSAGSIVRGGTITGPAAWDASTSGDFFDAVVLVPEGAHGCELDGLRIENVYRVGVGIKADHTRVHDCRIEGNVPAGVFTGTETSHYAVKIDPPGTDADGATVVADNIIGGCVQGVMVGNFGSGVGRGVVVSGNLFHDCWNHGIYQSHGNGMTFTGNTFQRCQKPIVASGRGSVVSGNSMWTSATGDERDITAISLRNAFDCVVVGNTVVGDASATAVGINLDNTLGQVALTRNIIANNTLNLTGTTVAAIRVGDPTETQTLRDNRVTGNIIRASAAASSSVIEVAPAAGYTGLHNAVDNNTIILVGPSHAIRADRQQYLSVSGNHVRIEADSVAPATAIMARLDTVTDSVVAGNTWSCDAAWGGNITAQGVREYAACDRNVLGPNVARWDTTKLAGSTAVMQDAPGNASLVAATVGEYAAATALGVLSGKVAVRDDKGTTLGFSPVYTSIT